LTVDTLGALRLQRRAIETWIRLTATASPGGFVVEAGDVLAGVVPVCPRRSLVNSAVHRGAAGLADALPELARTYADSGVRAAAMWTIEPDPEAEGLLEANGYRFDGEPAAMFLDLGELAPIDPGDLVWDTAVEPEEVGRVNDRAYGYPEGEGFTPAMGEAPPEFGVRSYRARVGGRTASVLQTIDIGSDCMISLVATLPEHRGERLASRLLGVALVEAAERGLETSTLQASMLGRGVYQRLGYETIGQLRLHERRVGSNS
jgi:GNAT superfamily N-acetyltransferase